MNKLDIDGVLIIRDFYEWHSCFSFWGILECRRTTEKSKVDLRKLNFSFRQILFGNPKTNPSIPEAPLFAY